MAELKLKDVKKVYPGNVTAVDDFNLDIKDGEFVVLVGPSGCGKSTTLRMVAGLEQITDGTVKVGERVINNVAPKNRDIAMVFQNYALYPHMSVFDNMAFGLKLRKYEKKEIRQRVQDAANILGIGELLDRAPKALSGGQRQRVALGRAIVRKPAVFLLDEPLSNLDAKMRVQMRQELSKLHERLQTTMIYVTHDQVEAMTMGDRIVVMKDGFMQQVAPPTELYDNPANKFVAGFIGTPPMNFFEGAINSDNGGLVFDEDNFRIPIPEAWQENVMPYKDKPVVFGVRPEDVGSPEAEAEEGTPTITATIEVVEPMGSETYLHLTTGKQTFISRVEPHRKCSPGDEMTLSVTLKKAHIFDYDSEEQIV